LVASDSNLGPMILQGPHHLAWKSTMMGTVDFKTLF